MEELLEAFQDSELSSAAIGFLCSHSEKLGLRLPLGELNKAFLGSQELVPVVVRGRTTQEVLLDCGRAAGASGGGSRPRKLVAMHYMRLLRYLSLEQLQILAAKVEARMMQRTPSLMVPSASRLPVSRSLSQLECAMAAAAVEATAKAEATEFQPGTLDTPPLLGSPLASINNFATDAVWDTGTGSPGSENGLGTGAPDSTAAIHHAFGNSPALASGAAAAAAVAAPSMQLCVPLPMPSKQEEAAPSPFKSAAEPSWYEAGPSEEGWLLGAMHSSGAQATAPSDWDFSCIPSQAKSSALGAWPSLQGSWELVTHDHSTHPTNKPQPTPVAATGAVATQMLSPLPRPGSAPSPTLSVGSSSSTYRGSTTGSLGSSSGHGCGGSSVGSKEVAHADFAKAAALLAAAVLHMEAGLSELQGAHGGQSLAAASALCHISAALKLQEGLAAFLSSL